MENEIEQINTGDRFGVYVMEEWIEASNLSKDVRYHLLTKNNDDTEPLMLFISTLCGLWIQLEPKVKGINNKELEKKFMAFKAYARDPEQIMKIEQDKKTTEAETRKQAIFDLEEILRTVIEELGVTKWRKQ